MTNALQTQRVGCGPRHPHGSHQESIQNRRGKGGKKAAKGTAEKAGKKFSEVVVEKGSHKIQQILRKTQPKTTPSMVSKNKAASQDGMLKLAQILGN